MLAATALVSSSSAFAVTDFGAAYGGRAGGNALLPWFVAGPAADRNTLIAIIHDDTIFPQSGEFLHVILFDVNSIPRCSACVPITENDVYTANALELVNDLCSGTNKAALDAGDGVPNDGVYAGYALFEPSFSPSCLSVNLVGREQDLVPHFYQVELASGLVAGFDGPVYEFIPGIPTPIRDFDKYALDTEKYLFFRILVGLDNAPGTPGENDRAQTKLIVWSNTSGNCNLNGGNAEPDAACLSRIKATVVCDEEESCTSQAPPLFQKESNIIFADDFVPNSFRTGGGWLAWRSDPTFGTALNVVGYADNQASGLGQTLNWRAIFPAQRGAIMP
ncbi:MAG: hypothetical protein ACREQQ_13025 [Candidatus Binatia bacterium]